MSELEQLLKKSRTLVRRNGRGRRHRRSLNNPPSQENAKANQANPSDAAPPTQTIGGILMQNVANRSTDIAGIGYNPDTKVLAVIFKKNAAIYHYPNFTLSGYKRLLKAHSIGSALKKLDLKQYTRVQ